jgi:hypothetical protein
MHKADRAFMMADWSDGPAGRELRNWINGARAVIAKTREAEIVLGRAPKEEAMRREKFDSLMEAVQYLLSAGYEPVPIAPGETPHYRRASFDAYVRQQKNGKLFWIELL